MVGIENFVSKNPYEDVAFIEMKDVIGKDIIINGVTPFESAKNGKGVHILMTVDGEPRRACTHAAAITNILSKESVLETLKEDTIDARIIERKSMNGRMMLAFDIPGAEDA